VPPYTLPAKSHFAYHTMEWFSEHGMARSTRLICEFLAVSNHLLSPIFTLTCQIETLLTAPQHTSPPVTICSSR
jgi:hypothetical protein